MGGTSRERQVSLWTGDQISNGLVEIGHDVTSFDLTHHNSGELIIRALEADLVFNALHGPGGEDGTVAGFLETIGAKYTHSGVFASAVAMDKYTTRKLAEAVGIRVPAGRLCTVEDLRELEFTFPYVIKPRFEGSTIGVTIIQDRSNQSAPTEWLFRGEPLVEKFIPGLEISCAVVNGTAIDTVEIEHHHSGIFDFDSKYLDPTTKHIIPARMPLSENIKAKQWSELIYEELGCKDVARVDFRYDPGMGEEGLFFLEVNTHPGMTSTSLLPDIMRANGVQFTELLAMIVNNHA